MKITYLGHAGFYVETKCSVILMDPWLSPFGAFDSSWFQYPKNSDMADAVREQFESSPKDKYIYISHEHKDHFDLPFLKKIKNRQFKFILANFHRSIVKEQLIAHNYACDGIVSLDYDEEYRIKDGFIRLFILDGELDCDSVILVKSDSGCFLNSNDCKLHDKFEKITKQYGPIDVFAGQFSGAIWHPVCYDMPLEDYQKVSLKKKMMKFATVSKSIQIINPAVYLPSAGPPCFLDPMLFHINFEKINIFPRAAEFLHYLDKHCKAQNTAWPKIMPGDILDVESRQFIHLTEKRVADSEFESYVKAYAKEYQAYFQERVLEHAKISPEAVFIALRQDLELKMQHLTLVNVEVNRLLYWRISDYPETMYCIDFTHKTITTTTHIDDPDNFWLVEAPAWQVQKVLSNEMNWPDFVLTFRVKLTRKPDLYDVITHGFIALDACEMERFSELVAHYHANNKERTIIEYDGKRYSILRWCPHMGGDLRAGWLENGSWVCPRHQWHFDICNQGHCLTSTDTINAICLGKVDPSSNTEN